MGAAPYMEHDKEEEFINVTQKYPNGTVLMTDDDPPKEKYVWLNKTHPMQQDINYLDVGEEVTMKCKDSLERPSEDYLDLDPYDGKITAVCQPDENYSVRVTQLA